MSKSNRGYYVMIYRSILQCMVIVLVGLPAWAQQQDEARNQSLHVYFIGNSVTDTMWRHFPTARSGIRGCLMPRCGQGKSRVISISHRS